MMPIRLRWVIVLLLGVVVMLLVPWGGMKAQSGDKVIVGTVIDRQAQPVEGAHVSLLAVEGGLLQSEAETQADGRFALSAPTETPGDLEVHVERAHFQEATIRLERQAIESLRLGDSVVLPETVLDRRISPAFWIAAATFLVVLLLIATGKLHNTLAALVGTAVLFGVSYLGPPFVEDLFIFDMHGALRYVDWNVIFLIMGMMIVIAVVEETGIFQWLAYTSYRISGGRVWLLMAILMVVTGVASAILDNVTTMLLMTPITIQISLALGINPLALLMPEVMASNVAGLSTLVGTPTNILIGSYADLSFTDFMIDLTPGVLLALSGLVIYSEVVYRRELKSSGGASEVLAERLAQQAKITAPDHLWKAGVVFAGMLVLFVIGERVHLLPAVTALIGATVLLAWIRPDIDEMIEAVDWTTLVFFIGLFVVVGAIREVGLISMIADLIGALVGGSLLLAMVVVIWVGALLSTIVANIPFTAAMLPVVGYLSSVVPGGASNALFFSLAVGSGMGGNGSLIGASANMVTAGIASRAGYHITYAYFVKKGFPALLITVGLATIWLLVRFLLL